MNADDNEIDSLNTSVHRNQNGNDNYALDMENDKRRWEFANSFLFPYYRNYSLIKNIIAKTERRVRISSITFGEAIKILFGGLDTIIF